MQSSDFVITHMITDQRLLSPITTYYTIQLTSFTFLLFITLFQIRDRNTKSGPPSSKFATVNLIDPSELQPISEKELILGQGSYGRCILKSFKRLNVLVVEKQCLMQSIKEMVKEAQIMQTLTHKNIPAIIGIQLEREPISLVMEFKGEENTSATVSILFYCIGLGKVTLQ